MFKNRQNKFVFFNFDKKTRKLNETNQVLIANTGKFFEIIFDFLVCVI